MSTAAPSIKDADRADWVGACTGTLASLITLIQVYVMATVRLQGRRPLCRSWRRGGRSPVGCGPTRATADRLADPHRRWRCCTYSPDLTGAHFGRHLAGYAGMLQAAAYAMFVTLCSAVHSSGLIIEGECWACGRRKPYELAKVIKVPPRPKRCDLRCRAHRRRLANLSASPASQGSGRTPGHQPRSPDGVRSSLSRHADVGTAMDTMIKRWERFR